MAALRWAATTINRPVPVTAVCGTSRSDAATSMSHDGMNLVVKSRTCTAMLRVNGMLYAAHQHPTPHPVLCNIKRPVRVVAVHKHARSTASIQHE